jgi:hypothetical protein
MARLEFYFDEGAILMFAVKGTLPFEGCQKMGSLSVGCTFQTRGLFL